MGTCDKGKAWTFDRFKVDVVHIVYDDDDGYSIFVVKYLLW